MWYGPNRRPPQRNNPYEYSMPWFIIMVVLLYLVFQIVIGLWDFVIENWWVIMVGAVIATTVYSRIKNSHQQHMGNNPQQTIYYQPPPQNSSTTSGQQSSSFYQAEQYQPYEQGYKSTNQQDAQQQYTQFQYSEQEQGQEAVYDEYDQPKAEYPQEMPPM